MLAARRAGVSDRRRCTNKHDIADLRTELKGDIVRVGEQTNSIETQLRAMNHTKLHARVADLEEKAFGARPTSTQRTRADEPE